MKNSSKKIITIITLSVAVLVFSMIPVTAAVASTPQIYVTDESVEIEAKYKKVPTNKVTFNANGGTINSRKTVATNIKKGSAIKKFPATPKRNGYTFKGWYTQKNGGKKINANVKPSKSVTLYAQWTKTLSKDEKKLIGTWGYHHGSVSGTVYTGYETYSHSSGAIDYYKSNSNILIVIYEFRGDGSYRHLAHCWLNGKFMYYYDREGMYSISKGKLHLTDTKVMKSSDGGKTTYLANELASKKVVNYSFGKENGRQYVEIIKGIKCFK